MKTIKPFIRRAACTVLFALISTIATASAATDQALIPFKIGIASPSINMLSIWVAQDQDFYKAQGLKVEIINMEGGSRGLVAVSAGDVQTNFVGLSAVVEANSKGNDLRMIASSANTMSYQLYSAPDIKSAADIKGKTIGVSAFNSESDFSTTLALKQLGLTRQDVKIVETGSIFKRLEALKAGRIQATPLNDPINMLAAQDGFVELVDLSKSTPWIFNGTVVSRSYLKANRDLFLKFLKAYIEGTYFALANEARTKEVIAKAFKNNDPKILDAAFADFKRRIPRDAEPSRQGAANILAVLPTIGTKVASTKVEDYIDASLIDDLKKSGFIEELKLKYKVP
jgi:NitT/TauT family transport system substrate-binding protein